MTRRCLLVLMTAQSCSLYTVLPGTLVLSNTHLHVSGKDSETLHFVCKDSLGGIHTHMQHSWVNWNNAV